MKPHIITAIVLMLIININSISYSAEPFLLKAEKIINSRSGEIPQAPRVSPDGNQIVFEYYSNKNSLLYSAKSDGASVRCLTCDFKMSLENAFWHPSGKYLVFNQVPKGNIKRGGIFTSIITDGKLSQVKKVAEGARPQFSSPNGHVIFFETSQVIDGRINNVLAYQILGRDPVNPSENIWLELRGPIQQVNKSVEVSHPSLAPDGTTIVFAASTTSIKSEYNIVLNDIDRQKIYALWKKLIGVKKEVITKELYTIINPENFAFNEQEIISPESISEEAFDDIMKKDNPALLKPTIAPGFTKRHLFLAWILGLIDLLDNRYDLKIQEMIFPRLWITDVFGAPFIPLVKDLSTAPLPQKWATISKDGRFAVFEAGHYTNRHIYLVAKNGNKWMDRAIKITESGTYNSSPEIDPKGESLYFESNRDGTKAIWRAKLNWNEINKKLGL